MDLHVLFFGAVGVISWYWYAAKRGHVHITWLSVLIYPLITFLFELGNKLFSKKIWIQKIQISKSLGI